MRLFECQHCGQPLYFENTQCQSCARKLGYIPDRQTMSALEPLKGGEWRALGDCERPYKFCANARFGSCNWVIAADSPDEFCAACRHNRVIPDLSTADNLRHWRLIEVAKHRLFYTLLQLELPLATRNGHPEGLGFDFLSDAEPSQPLVMTGHERGLITINLAEADDSERERRRHDLGEAYRTLLGHFRHEVGHYFWDRLVRERGHLDDFRAVFGDERADYGLALQVHYANGAPSDWQERFVSGYASAHPWEDFAETWAHYLHIVDTLETASAFGLRVRPRTSRGTGLEAAVDFDPHDDEGMERLIAAWQPITFAVNSLNRSMGQPDLYPFVLSPVVILKLDFVHRMVHLASGRSGDEKREPLKTVIAGLRAAVPIPHPS